MYKNKFELKLHRYQHQIEEGEEEQIVNIGQVARAINDEQLALLISEYLNIGFKGHRNGIAVGKAGTRFHRTIQRSFIGWLIGAIVSMAEQEYWDDRNATAVKAAKKIAKLYKDGDLNIGPMI